MRPSSTLPSFCECMPPGVSGHTSPHICALPLTQTGRLSVGRERGKLWLRRFSSYLLVKNRHCGGLSNHSQVCFVTKSNCTPRVTSDFLNNSGLIAQLNIEPCFVFPRAIKAASTCLCGLTYSGKGLRLTLSTLQTVFSTPKEQQQ